MAVVLLAATAVAVAACDRGPLAERAGRAQQALGNGRLPRDVRPTPAMPARFAVGRAATPAELARWDVDIAPDGTGLPQGRGTATQGAAVYVAKCAMCHGAAGEGQAGAGPPLPTYAVAPRIVGREPRDSFPFGRDPRYVKTVGNYWPYATTVFDYVRRAMPLNAPGSLTDSEVYAVVAYLLAENEIIDRDAVMDSLSLPAVRMPGRDHFVPDDRKGGATFR